MRKESAILKNNNKKEFWVYMSKKLKIDIEEFEKYQKKEWSSPLLEFIRILYQRRFPTNTNKE